MYIAAHFLSGNYAGDDFCINLPVYMTPVAVKSCDKLLEVSGFHYFCKYLCF